MNADNYDALTFDVYGTLIDWEPTIVRLLGELVAGGGKQASEAKLLDGFDRARAHYQEIAPARPYPRILRSAFAYVADEYGLVADGDAQLAFGASVGD